MNQTKLKWTALAVALAAILTLGACMKNVAAPPPPPPPAPTASLKPKPETIQRGHSSIPVWTTADATDINIEGLGSVEANGSRAVSPNKATTYQLVAKGPGGTQESTEQAQPQYSMSVESPLVVVDVLVTDEDGNVLTGLKKGNFRILDEGRPQNVTAFASADASITLVILMEYSGIAYDYFAYKGAYWGTEFLDHLELQDWVALVTYDMKPTVRVDFTKSKPAVEQALKTLSYPGFREANMFDALLDTLDRLQGVKGKKAILLITTGVDTFSRSTLDEVYDKLKQSNVTIFCVATAESESLMAERQGGGSSIGYLQLKNQLQTFAELTGGFAWFPRFEGELPDLFRSVGGTLRNQYALGFSPTREFRDGRYHKLKVQVVGADGLPLKARDEKGRTRNIEVYARRGYTAPTNLNGEPD